MHGTMKAQVFPLPVCAHAMRSRPDTTMGIEFFCTGVALFNGTEKTEGMPKAGVHAQQEYMHNKPMQRSDEMRPQVDDNHLAVIDARRCLWLVHLRVPVLPDEGPVASDRLLLRLHPVLLVETIAQGASTL